MPRDLLNHIDIKGIRDGLLISIRGASPWEEVIRELVTRIDAQRDFFQGARVALDVGGRRLESANLSRLRATLAEREVNLWAVLGEEPTTLEAVRSMGLETHVAKTEVPPEKSYEPVEALAPIDTEVKGSTGILVKRTLRSGSTVRHAGHVIIIGDVNPGAEVVAGGDVVVWGRLRGVVHAGVNGDQGAVICALDLSPTQLRIADHIAISPAEPRPHAEPEIASVRGGFIIAEAWK